MPFYIRYINTNAILILHCFMAVVASRTPIFSTIWGWSVVIFGSYYITKYKAFQQYKTRVCGRIFDLPLDHFERVDINYQEDYEFAKSIYQAFSKNNK